MDGRERPVRFRGHRARVAPVVVVAPAGLHVVGFDLGDDAGGQSWLDRAVMVLAEEAGVRLLAEVLMDAVDLGARV